MANFNLYNSPFDNFTQRTYVPQTPQNRLQVAYQQAMAKRTPEWARTISDMMPSIAEMVAYGTTKGAFNQGRIADSLEREKQRRIAYNQMMRENEDKQVNDYVQLAKEQLGIDMAEDDKEYGRNLDQIKRDEELEKQKRAYEQYEEQQRIAEEQRKFDNDIKEREMKLKESALSSENLQKQAEAKAKEEQDKERQKQLEGYVKTAEDMFKNGLIDNETLWAIKKNPELAEKLTPKKTWLGFSSSPKKMELDLKEDSDYQIFKDENGNLAKVYKNGRIEEL